MIRMKDQTGSDAIMLVYSDNFMPMRALYAMQTVVSTDICTMLKARQLTKQQYCCLTDVEIKSVGCIQM